MRGGARGGMVVLGVAAGLPLLGMVVDVQRLLLARLALAKAVAAAVDEARGSPGPSRPALEAALAAGLPTGASALVFARPGAAGLVVLARTDLPTGALRLVGVARLTAAVRTQVDPTRMGDDGVMP